MTLPQTFLPSGTLTIGANYWASHAGPRMWRDWDAEVVARDFAQLAAFGIQVLRVFPLWPDFQPIHTLRGGGGTFMEVRFGEAPLPSDEPGKSGVDAEMLRRFGVMADLAADNVFFLSVPLETSLAQTNGAFLPDSTPCWMIYKTLAETQLGNRLVIKTSPLLGITEHRLDSKDTVVVLINYSPAPVKDVLTLSSGCEFLKNLHGPQPTDTARNPIKIQLPPNGFAVWLCRRR